MASSVQDNSNSHSISEPVTSSQRQPFTSTHLPALLQNGWILSLNVEQILVGWGEWQTAAQPLQGPSSCSLYAPDFHLKAEKPWRMTRNWDSLSLERFASIVLSSNTVEVNAEQDGFTWQEPPMATFEERWHSIQNGFQSRELKKAVPVVFAATEGDVGVTRRMRILTNLMDPTRRSKALFYYGFWETKSDEDLGMLGATPEILFTQAADKTLETVAMAGTRGKGTTLALGDEAHVLLNDPKERHEHQLVLDDIQSVLKDLGVVSSSETQAIELPTLFHLKTQVRVHLQREVSFAECVRRLHPTPALGVAPRALGFTEIRRWDSAEERDRYGAPFGVEFQNEQGESVRHCLVAIRNIQWRNRQVWLGSGCGVVPESRLDREWRELQLKRDSVRRILSI